MEIIKLLLEDDRVDVNMYGNEYSPLFMAAYGKHAVIVDLLLERGADLELKDIVIRSYSAVP